MFTPGDEVLISPPIESIVSTTLCIGTVLHRDLSKKAHPNSQRVYFQKEKFTLWVENKRLTKISRSTHPEFYI
jgi:hypothetical protein